MVKIRAREAHINKLLLDAKIAPDVATIMALRKIHDRLVTFNRKTNFLIDRASDGPVH